ncbi:MAG: PHP domain-containing protein [Lachnospiraceae bacterium]|nr:PHP domain-containing protein [Lachnospiraceae bacterium]
MQCKKELFHVHTYRCRHAEEIPDEAYVKKAITFGATDIWFTDHAPFPDRDFKHCMPYKQLEDYLNSILSLKEIYASQINVHVGLEAEYYPFYDKSGYYQALKDDERIELLLLGQHLAEVEPGVYTISWDAKRREAEEFQWLGQATCLGMKSGYFDVLAHPDRIFRRRKVWTDSMEQVSRDIIKTAKETGMPLEQNEASKREGLYWQQFWDLVPEGIEIVHGLDAHELKELISVFYK